MIFSIIHHSDSCHLHHNDFLIFEQRLVIKRKTTYTNFFVKYRAIK
jgi:hypothetical protein